MVANESKFYLAEALVVNKEVRQIMGKIKAAIDADFLSFPQPELARYGKFEMQCYEIGNEHESIVVPVDLTQASLVDLGKAYSLTLATLARGREMLSDYKGRLFTLDTSREAHEGQVTLSSVKQSQKVGARGSVKDGTATEVKARTAADESLQILNSTHAFYKSAIFTLESRIRSYEDLLSGISREYSRRKLDE